MNLNDYRKSDKPLKYRDIGTVSNMANGMVGVGQPQIGFYYDYKKNYVKVDNSFHIQIKNDMQN